MATLDIPNAPQNIPTDVIDNKDYTLDEPEHFQANVDLQTKKLVLSLPKTKSWLAGHVYLFQGYWCKPQPIQATLRAQAHFSARDSDVVVSTFPKCGTTWLKGLAFAITQRARHPPADPVHPLLANNPHDLVPFMEYKVYAGAALPDLGGLPSPRLFGTHVPYGSMPESVRSSGCKIVYICRNPFDTFVSTWVFMNKGRQQIKSKGGVATIEEAFDMYCNGEVTFGPFWDHLLGYWNASLKSPDKVMFLKYEDMKNDPGFTKIKELAKFLGYGFSAKEEKEGVVEEVAALCSFETMKDLKVNQKGNSVGASFGNDTLFRKAKVGDYTNHLSKEMIGRLTKVMKEKLDGSGLEFDM